MRYTEVRMTRLALEMLRDINKDTVDFQPNFDESEKEPRVLPARFPNLIVNRFRWYCRRDGDEYITTQLSRDYRRLYRLYR